MLQVIEANWVAFALVLLIGLLVAWWLFRRARTPERRERRPDVLDEGAAPAQRNQSLIDAPSASAVVQAGAGPETPTPVGETEGASAAEEAAVAPPPPQPVPPAGEADDLRRIKGVGPKLVTLLHSLGITRYEQIAGWTEEDIDRIDPQLGAFAGRIHRDSWVEQAGFLAAGDTAGFEAKFGKL
jgi:predicted flap endonuclease-1-like 5' DNA nuclease